MVPRVLGLREALCVPISSGAMPPGECIEACLSGGTSRTRFRGPMSSAELAEERVIRASRGGMSVSLQQGVCASRAEASRGQTPEQSL